MFSYKIFFLNIFFNAKDNYYILISIDIFKKYFLKKKF